MILVVVAVAPLALECPHHGCTIAESPNLDESLPLRVRAHAAHAHAHTHTHTHIQAHRTILFWVRG